MSRQIRKTAIALLGTVLVAQGCATKAQLRRGLEAQQAALEAERSERVAADQRLSSDLQALRADLDRMRTEFSTQITALEQGMQFVVPIHFAFDAADVGQDAQPVLNRFAEVVQRHYPNAMITIEGFADPAGSAAYNKALSERRAAAVRTYLSQNGLDFTHLRTIGYGEDRLVAPGAERDETGAHLNRRVVFVVETPPNALPATTQTTLR